MSISSQIPDPGYRPDLFMRATTFPTFEYGKAPEEILIEKIREASKSPHAQSPVFEEGIQLLEKMAGEIRENKYQSANALKLAAALYTAEVEQDKVVAVAREIFSFVRNLGKDSYMFKHNVCKELLNKRDYYGSINTSDVGSLLYKEVFGKEGHGSYTEGPEPREPGYRELKSLLIALQVAAESEAQSSSIDIPYYGFEKLNELKKEECDQVTEAGLESMEQLPEGSFAHCTKLKVGGEVDLPTLLTWVSKHMPSLEVLDLSDAKRLRGDEEEFKEIQLQSLREISRNSTWQKDSLFVYVEALKKYPHLREHYASIKEVKLFCKSISDHTLLTYLRLMPNLEHVDLTHIGKIIDSDSLSCPQLKQVTSIKAICWSPFLKALVTNSPHLAKLELYDYEYFPSHYLKWMPEERRVRHSNFKAFSQKMPKSELQQLDPKHTRYIDPSRLPDLSNEQFSQIESEQLEGMQQESFNRVPYERWQLTSENIRNNTRKFWELTLSRDPLPSKRALSAVYPNLDDFPVALLSLLSPRDLKEILNGPKAQAFLKGNESSRWLYNASERFKEEQIRVIPEHLVGYLSPKTLPFLTEKQMGYVPLSMIEWIFSGYSTINAELLKQVDSNNWRFASESVKAKVSKYVKIAPKPLRLQDIQEVYLDVNHCPPGLLHYFSAENLRELNYPENTALQQDFKKATISFDVSQIHALSAALVPLVDDSRVKDLSDEQCVLLNVHQYPHLSPDQITNLSEEVFLRMQWKHLFGFQAGFYRSFEDVKEVNDPKVALENRLQRDLGKWEQAGKLGGKTAYEFLEEIYSERKIPISLFGFLPDEKIQRIWGADVALWMPTSLYYRLSPAQIEYLRPENIRRMTYEEIEKVGFEKWKEAAEEVKAVLPSRMRSFRELNLWSKMKVAMRAVRVFTFSLLAVPLLVLFPVRNFSRRLQSIWGFSAKSLSDLGKWFTGKLIG